MKTNTHNLSVPIAHLEGESAPCTQERADRRTGTSPSRTFQTSPALAGLVPNRSTIQTAQPLIHRKPLRRLMSATICGASRAHSVHEVKAAPRTVSAADLRRAAAHLADAATDSRHALYLDFSSAMCWDAVKLCATTAGFSLTVSAQHGLVSLADRQVDGPQAMTDLPEGHAIGFFDGDRLIHAMISIGSGRAAGNKNDCIGIGSPIGWESLDLRSLRWDQNGAVLAPGLLQPERKLVMRSRALDATV